MAHTGAITIVASAAAAVPSARAARWPLCRMRTGGDPAARTHLAGAGYPEYKHALGHSVGLACHDGGPLIGPRWLRYGDAPERAIEPNSVYTLELGTQAARGYIGLEDEVLAGAARADLRKVRVSIPGCFRCA